MSGSIVVGSIVVGMSASVVVVIISIVVWEAARASKQRNAATRRTMVRESEGERGVSDRVFGVYANKGSHARTCAVPTDS